MVQAFDHRTASVVINPENLNRPAQPLESTLKEHMDPNFYQRQRSGFRLPKYHSRSRNQWVGLLCTGELRRLPMPAQLLQLSFRGAASVIPFRCCGLATKISLLWTQLAYNRLYRASAPTMRPGRSCRARA